MTYKIHPVAALFPMIPKGSRPYNDLEEHIRLFGQLEPIVVDGDTLLDGRNRLAICEDCGIKPKIVQWSTLGISNPQHEWIFGKNVARRNLTEEQRAQVYVDYSAWTDAEDAKERVAKAQFKAGESGNPTGKAKEQARTESCEPAKRDHKAEHARSTVGKVAAGAGISHHKAAKLVAVNKAAAAGDEKAMEDVEAIRAGLKKIRDIAKPTRPDRPAPTLRQQLESWWPKCLDRFAVADHAQVKQWIKETV